MNINRRFSILRHNFWWLLASKGLNWLPRWPDILPGNSDMLVNLGLDTQIQFSSLLPSHRYLLINLSHYLVGLELQVSLIWGVSSRRDAHRYFFSYWFGLWNCQFLASFLVILLAFVLFGYCYWTQTRIIELEKRYSTLNKLAIFLRILRYIIILILAIGQDFRLEHFDLEIFIRQGRPIHFVLIKKSNK